MAAPQNFPNNFGTNHFIKLEIRDSRPQKKEQFQQVQEHKEFLLSSRVTG